MSNQASHRHHYNPVWYQNSFADATGFYWSLNCTPQISGPEKPRRKAPRGCFYEDNLNTLRFGSATSDKIETDFFGRIDNDSPALQRLASYSGLKKGCDVGADLTLVCRYMGAQRMRTPRGLRKLEEILQYDGIDHPNAKLIFMTRLYQLHATMWREGVWEIVHAHDSPTKFITSDNPVTFYNQAVPEGIDAGYSSLGTRTIFPLTFDSCVILTHVQFARNPRLELLPSRSNARSFSPTMKYLGDIQYGRQLTEDEVVRINLIIKRRAEKYIAAREKDWLYPERHVVARWDHLDDDWFLLPNLWMLGTGGETMAGFRDGTVWRQDEYGRSPGDASFSNALQRDQERRCHDMSKKLWASRRRGKSHGQVDPSSMNYFIVGDMNRYLDTQSAADKQRLASYSTARFPVIE